MGISEGRLDAAAATPLPKEFSCFTLSFDFYELLYLAKTMGIITTVPTIIVNFPVIDVAIQFSKHCAEIQNYLCPILKI